jgi:O-glycosyl hydrolase
VSLVLLSIASPNAWAAQVTIDRTQRSQTIDGFGFFGAHDVWWGQPADLVNTAWFDAVVDDLGITIWRNELPPPADAIAQQDADWTKMRPVVQAISAKAKSSGVPLKIILTVWSPPSSMKCVVGTSGVQDGTPHPGGTKNGGGLCPSKRAAYADWLVAGLKQYADIGVDVYGLSFQNEPLFVEFYNSCVYNSQEYADTLAAIGPVIHAAYPNVKLFGSENMLAIECGGKNGFDPYWYTANVMSRPAALSQMGIWAVHGYSDGVLATPTSQMSKYWASFYAGTQSTHLPIWMTETSGYVDTIEAGPNASGDTLPGALDLAQSIYAALYHGHLSGWVWWQGSELGAGMPSEFDLMSSVTKRGKKYYVSKNYYRYIRPGAQMVQASSDDTEVLVAAFDHATANTLTIIAINGGTASKSVTLTGANLPATFQAYRTSATEDCAAVGAMAPASITLPARSITSLVFGDTSKDPSAPDGGAGAGGSGGTTGGSGGATGGSGGSTAGSGGTTGGRGGAGGASGGSGGARASGGTSGSSGGLSSSGGASGGSGGSGASGGTSGSSGGLSSSGGASGGSGGSGETTSTGSGPGGTTASAKSGGCSCRVAGSPLHSGTHTVALLGMGLLLVRRRTRRHPLRKLPGSG